jgi:hypothetical protein
MRIPRIAFVVVVGVGIACGDLGVADMRRARADDASATVVATREKFDAAVRARGKDLADVARWCDRSDLPGWGAIYRVRALTCRPDDKRLLNELGYVKEGDTYRWPDEAREAFRALDPGGLAEPAGLHAQRMTKRKLGVNRFVAVAKTATAPDDAPLAVRDELAALRHQVWERVIEIDPLHGEAARELGYVNFDGRAVHPDAKPFLEARARRRAQAAAIVESEVFLTRGGGGDRAVSVTAGGIRVDGYLPVPGLELVARAIVHARQAFAARLRLGESDDVPTGISVVCVCTTKNQYVDAIVHYGGGSRAEALETAQKWAANWATPAIVVMRKSSAAQAAELSSAYACRGAARALRSRRLGAASSGEPRNEDWIYDAIAMDVTIGLTGSYGQSISSDEGTTEKRNLTGTTSWLDRARLAVELRDDPALSGIVQRDMNSLRSPEAAKGYAFLQFIFELDSLKAAAFFDQALVVGGAAAAESVYGSTLGELDSEYRRWALLTLEPAGQ